MNGAVLQRGAGLPTYDSTKDIVLAPNMHLYESLVADPTNVFLDFKPFNSSTGETYFWNSFEGGNINFYRSGGTRAAKVLAFGINATGPLTMTPGGTLGLGSPLQSVGGSGTGLYNLLTGAGNTEEKNSFSTGTHDIYMSNGATNASTKMFSWLPNGHMIGQAGGTFTDIATSRLTFNTTTEGVMVFPRMTTTQRNAIAGSGITVLTVSSAGSGYTNGSYTAVPLTGGSGTGALVSVSIGGGAIGTVVITTAGTGYKIGDVLSFSAASVGGTGSGYSSTVSAITDEGLNAYDLTRHRPCWNSGSGWKCPLDSTESAAANALKRDIADTTGPNGTARNGHVHQIIDSLVGTLVGGGSGTYTPTITNTLNVTSNALGSARYTKTGNVIHLVVSGTLSPTASAANTTLTFSLPFTSSTATGKIVGTGTIAPNSGSGTAYVAGLVTMASSTTVDFQSFFTGGTSTANYCIQIDFDL